MKGSETKIGRKKKKKGAKVAEKNQTFKKLNFYENLNFVEIIKASRRLVKKKKKIFLSIFERQKTPPLPTPTTMNPYRFESLCKDIESSRNFSIPFISLVISISTALVNIHLSRC